jgi:cytochrome subunit of sulfide dehydrogenase
MANFLITTILSLMLCWGASVTSAETLVPESLPEQKQEGLPSLTLQGCFACHGPAGNSQGPAIPSIAGLPRDYLLQGLKAYRHGGRFSTLMGRLLRGVTDEQLVEMADFFSRQVTEIPKQRIDWDQASRGRQLHRLYCRKCHGDRKREPDAGVPRLNGQWMDYLRWTLQDYLFGANQSDEEMSEALIRLIRRHGDAGVESLIQYYGSARPDRAAEQ